MSKDKPIYPRGTLVASIKEAITARAQQPFTVSEIIEAVKLELPKARPQSIRAQITFNLVRAGWVAPTHRIYDEYRYTRPKKMGKEKAKSQPIETTLDDDAWFTSAQIGKHVVNYVESLKRQIDDLEGECFAKDKQINELQALVNQAKQNGGLSVKEIMKGDQS